MSKARSSRSRVSETGSPRRSPIRGRERTGRRRPACHPPHEFYLSRPFVIVLHLEATPWSPLGAQASSPAWLYEAKQARTGGAPRGPSDPHSTLRGTTISRKNRFKE